MSAPGGVCSRVEGVSTPRGVSAPGGGGVWPRGVSALGGCLLLGGSAPGGGVCSQGGVCSWGCLLPGGSFFLAYGQRAGGTHPTGMHSCLISLYFLLKLELHSRVMEHLNSHNYTILGNGYRKNQQSTLQNIGPQDPQKTPTHGYECGMPTGININVSEVDMSLLINQLRVIVRINVLCLRDRKNLKFYVDMIAAQIT